VGKDLNSGPSSALLNPALHFALEPPDAALAQAHRRRKIPIADELIEPSCLEADAAQDLRKPKENLCHNRLSMRAAQAHGPSLGDSVVR
jgi:hypothetical protein